MRRIGWLLAVAVLLTACSSTPTHHRAADRLAAELGTPYWATSVAVGSGTDRIGRSYAATVVELSSSATPDQVAGFVAALPQAVHRVGLGAGFQDRQLTFVGPTGARLSVAWQPVVDRGQLVRGVAEWLGVARALPDASVRATLLTDGGASYRLDLGDGRSSAVPAAYRRLRPLAQVETNWSLSSSTDGDAVQLAADRVPPDSQLRLWSGLLDRLSSLPAPLAPLRLTVSLTSDRAVVDEAFAVPDRVTADQLTVGAYGDRLWPVLRPQLSALAGVATAWTFDVSWAPRSDPASETTLFALLSDQAVADTGDASARWSHAAQRYLALRSGSPRL